MDFRMNNQTCTVASVQKRASAAAETVERKHNSLREAFGAEYRPEGNQPCFVEARAFLQKVRDGKHRIELLKERIAYRKKCGLETIELGLELAEKEQQVALDATEVYDEISKLKNVSLEMVLACRYIDAMAWIEIAEKLDLKIRTVHHMHGQALPRMQRILLDDGLIEIAEADTNDHIVEAADAPEQGEEDEFFND